MPPVQVEGPLQRYLDGAIWAQLTAAPVEGPSVLTTPTPPPARYVIACNPSDLVRALRYGKKVLVWDVWEDYAANFRFAPVYRGAARWLRRLAWTALLPFRARVSRYWLAEYTYAGLVPLSHSAVFPNAFVEVEAAPPLLPDLVGEYALYTGNLTESWGIFAAIEKALSAPERPFVLAGSVKSPLVAERIAEVLSPHRAWLWLRSRFVPYPVIQNLQRYAKCLYAPYLPLPHLREKIAGKFYEAAALRLPCVYPKGISRVWDAFWGWESGAPQLFWSHYEPLLWEEVERLLESLEKRR